MNSSNSKPNQRFVTLTSYNFRHVFLTAAAKCKQKIKFEKKEKKG